MTSHSRPRPLRPLAAAIALVLAGLLALAGGLLVSAGTDAAQAKVAPLKVSTAQNATLGKKILVTSSGRTLYTLSAETNGTFICRDASCLATWPPLILKAGQKATGVKHLGAVKRPDGRRQATYRGRPLYRFASDRKKGDVKGEGFRDVGTWHAPVARRDSDRTSSGMTPIG